MPLLHWIRRLVVGAFHLAGAVFRGVVALFRIALDLGLRLVARLYDRFDARWTALARESRARRRLESGR